MWLTTQPCHLVPSSRVRLLTTTAVAFLHLDRSLASHLKRLKEFPFMLFTLSSHLVIDLPRILFHASPSITSFSIPRSSLTTCPKYLKAVCATLDSSVHSGVLFSSTYYIHFTVFPSIQDTLITRFQHLISNASTFFLLSPVRRWEWQIAAMTVSP